MAEAPPQELTAFSSDRPNEDVNDDYDETNIDRPSTGRLLPAIPGNPPDMSVDDFTELKNRHNIYKNANNIRWKSIKQPDYKRFVVRDKNVYFNNKVALFQYNDFNKPYAISTIEGKELGKGLTRALGMQKVSKVTTFPTYSESSTNTEGLTGREIEGLNEELTHFRGQLRLATDKYTTAQERLKELNSKQDLSEEEKQELAKLPDEIEARKIEISGYIKKIAETEPSLRQIIKSDISIREKLKMVFDKYGYTITGFVTALGLLVGLLVEALKPVPLPTSGGSAPSNPASSALKTIGKWLKAIGEKVLAAIPGLIGSLISFLFKAASEVVTFLGENLWALVMLSGAIIYEMLKHKT